jgi:hypothetical protein
LSFEKRQNVVQLVSADMLSYVAAKARNAELKFPQVTLGRDAYLASAFLLTDGLNGKIRLGNIPKSEMQRQEKARLDAAMWQEKSIEEKQ